MKPVAHCLRNSHHFSALSYYRRGQLADAVLAHALTNALIAAYVLISGDWSLWS